MQVGDHHRHAVEGVRVAQQLVVRRTLLVGPGHHRLQRQIAGLDQVPGRLRRLCGDPAVRVQHRDHQRVAAGAQAAVQGRDIEQHPVADGRGSHQVGVGQSRYLGGGSTGVTPRDSQLHGSAPLAAQAVTSHRPK